MKRLILIHGINNEGSSEEKILETWIDALARGAGKDAAWAAKVRAASAAPFYGDALADASRQHPGVLALGPPAPQDDFELIAEKAIAALGAGASPEAIVASWERPDGPVPQGAGVHKKWVKAAARVVEYLSPELAKLALRILKQAHVYLVQPAAAIAVDNIVRAVMEESKSAVIVTHSLGTIVSYKLLREFANGKRQAPPLYVTLGSPLAIEVFKETFSEPRSKPRDVARWVNGSDPEDFVALHPRLTVRNFGRAVDRNIVDIDNGYDDPHSITGYLSNPTVAQEITAHL